MVKKTIEQVDASLARWQSRLKRAVTAIDRMQKLRKRMVKAASAPPKMTKAETLAEPALRAIAGMPKPDPDAKLVPVVIDTSIPAFLRRPTKSAADAAAADQIRQRQADAKKAKATARASRKAADKSGATRKMPLSGKAALDAIRNG